MVLLNTVLCNLTPAESAHTQRRDSLLCVCLLSDSEAVSGFLREAIWWTYPCHLLFKIRRVSKLSVTRVLRRLLWESSNHCDLHACRNLWQCVSAAWSCAAKERSAALCVSTTPSYGVFLGAHILLRQLLSELRHWKQPIKASKGSH